MLPDSTHSWLLGASGGLCCGASPPPGFFWNHPWCANPSSAGVCLSLMNSSSVTTAPLGDTIASEGAFFLPTDHLPAGHHLQGGSSPHLPVPLPQDLERCGPVCPQALAAGRHLAAAREGPVGSRPLPGPGTPDPEQAGA